MGNWGFVNFIGYMILLVLLILSKPSKASIQKTGSISSATEASQMGYIDNMGMFLLSNDSTFALGFQPTKDVTLFLLVIIHQDTSTVVWTANRGSPVQNSDNFVLDNKGKVCLESGEKAVWVPDTKGTPVSEIGLLDSGNLVLLGSDGSVLWDSFSHPTNTLLSNQSFVQGMKLVSDPDPNSNNLSYFLEISNGDMVLSSGYKTPQTYWSMEKDTRKIINKAGGPINSAKIESNSWKLYDKDNTFFWQFLILNSPGSMNTTWAAILGNDGVITFSNLGSSGGSRIDSSTKIPVDDCGTPEPCDAYEVCSSKNCQCPSGLVSRGCKPEVSSPCGHGNESLELVYAGDNLSYFALGFEQPQMKSSNLFGCQASCSRNCSCLGLFFDNSSGDCFLFDRIGSFLSYPTSKYSVYVKASANGNVGNGSGGSSNGHLAIILSIALVTLVIIAGLIYGGYRYYLKKKDLLQNPQETSEEDNFLESLSGMPLRYSYRSLQEATNNFSVKLGQGGFGSVYQGALPDGTRLAVKKLEGVGQGKKEFRAEVSIIGSIHHVHLVRLRGFCAEGSYRLLAYEFMPNNSLDKWIFKRTKDNKPVLDWETRYNIAIGTAKGLAYLHEDCDVKIIHCDIKPENVLLDEQFEAKVSDFGLAKLMTREQSHVYTTLRGTRGYLAPEWITNYAISEKSDVYSYGMVLLEIIGGRKNYDPGLTSEKSHFPAYAFKMMEEGKLREVLDSSLKYDPNDESVMTAIKVALWCIQEDMGLRPPMTKVVQMLEGVSQVPMPPTSSMSGARLFTSFFKSMSDDGTGTGASSGPSDCNSDAYLSAVRLSGPR